MQRYREMSIRTAALSVTFAVTLVSQPWLLADDRANIIEAFDVERNGDFLLIPVTIDGRQYQFGLDTGCSVTAFDTSLKPLLTPLGETIPLDETGSVDLFECRRGSIGKSKLPLAKWAVCLDLAPFRERSGFDIRGVLGMDFLVHHILEIDFDNGRVTFIRNSDSAQGEIVPIASFSKGVPVVKGAIPGDEATLFLIDTGLCGFDDGKLTELAFGNLARSRHLTISDEPHKSLSVTGVRTYREGTLSDLRVATLRNSGLTFGESKGKWNVLGLGYLSRFKVTFDFAKRRLHLVQGKQFNRRSVPRLRIGFTIIDVDGQRVITDVEEQGLGHKCGVRDADRIIEINGQSAAEMSFFQLQGLLRCGGELKLSSPNSTNVRVIRLSPKP